MISKSPVRIAVAGAGLIGKRHVHAIHQASSSAILHSIIDPTDAAYEYAANLGVPWYSCLSEMIGTNKSDGIILAIPNQAHVQTGLECIAAGIPVLVEKPLAIDSVSGEALVAAAEAAGVALLTGHHRRHNPLIRRAKQEIDAGSIGSVVSVNGMVWLYKPDDYFDVAWRSKAGAGPVFINLIHDIDLMHYLCGRIETVYALESNIARGNEVEDSAVIVLKFSNGALGTFNASDTIVSPWSWELTARENPTYPPTSEACYLIGGTHGSLELPGLRLWTNPSTRSWLEPIQSTQLPFDFEDPLILQIHQFAAVIQGREKPLVSGYDGLQALRVIEAIKQSAAAGMTISVAYLKAEYNREGAISNG